MSIINLSKLNIVGMFFASVMVSSVYLPETPAFAASSPAPTLPLFPELSYPDAADLALRAPIVVLVDVAKATRLKGELAPDLSADSARFLIDADVRSLLKGADGLAGTIEYIVDFPLDSRGKPPVLKGRQFILFGDRVAEKPQEIRLISAHSAVDWSAPAESRLRAILTEANAADAPPRITGIARAFHVPGAVAGESETQIFLTTHNGRPVSLNVLRRPGEQPHWAVALAEIVDDSAAPPVRDGLLWYRLACFLPRQLPDAAVADMEPANAAAASDDYAVILAGLGACVRAK